MQLKSQSYTNRTAILLHRMVKFVTFCCSTGEEALLTKVKLKAFETSISTTVNNKHYSYNITDYIDMYNYVHDFNSSFPYRTVYSFQMIYTLQYVIDRKSLP